MLLRHTRRIDWRCFVLRCCWSMTAQARKTSFRTYSWVCTGTLGRSKNAEAVFAYLRTAVVNRARSVLRRRRTAREHIRVLDPDCTEPADFKLLLNEEHQSVIAAV
jgi:hypothetical protein